MYVSYDDNLSQVVIFFSSQVEGRSRMDVIDQMERCAGCKEKRSCSELPEE
jgi:hypothetical protein